MVETEIPLGATAAKAALRRRVKAVMAATVAKVVQADWVEMAAVLWVALRAEAETVPPMGATAAMAVKQKVLALVLVVMLATPKRVPTAATVEMQPQATAATVALVAYWAAWAVMVAVLKRVAAAMQAMAETPIADIRAMLVMEEKAEMEVLPKRVKAVMERQPMAWVEMAVAEKVVFVELAAMLAMQNGVAIWAVLVEVKVPAASELVVLLV